MRERNKKKVLPKDKEFEEEQSVTPRKNLIAENALLLELYSRDRKNLSLEEIEKTYKNPKEKHNYKRKKTKK